MTRPSANDTNCPVSTEEDGFSSISCKLCPRDFHAQAHSLHCCSRSEEVGGIVQRVVFSNDFCVHRILEVSVLVQEVLARHRGDLVCAQQVGGFFGESWKGRMTNTWKGSGAPWCGSPAPCLSSIGACSVDDRAAISDPNSGLVALERNQVPWDVQICCFPGFVALGCNPVPWSMQTTTQRPPTAISCSTANARANPSRAFSHRIVTGICARCCGFPNAKTISKIRKLAEDGAAFSL